MARAIVEVLGEDILVLILDLVLGRAPSNMNAADLTSSQKCFLQVFSSWLWSQDRLIV